MTLRPLVVMRLLLRFVWHCILAGFSTAQIILRREKPPAGLVKMSYEPMSKTGVAVLGALVTLTPGSSAVDINRERREILLHLLDIRTAQENIEAIRRDFEQDIKSLFPEKRPC